MGSGSVSGVNSGSGGGFSGSFASLEGQPNMSSAPPTGRGVAAAANAGSSDPAYMMAALEQEQLKQKRIREDFEWR